MHIVTPYIFFFFNDTATTEIYTLSLHDALPISRNVQAAVGGPGSDDYGPRLDLVPTGQRNHDPASLTAQPRHTRSEEHTSELQSRQYLVCRLLLEKKKYIVCRFILEKYKIDSYT